MATECYISVRDMQYSYYHDGFKIVATTDIPCHLYMRWTTVKPQKHIVPRFTRGIFMHEDIYLCFVAYLDNEQEEAGDTYIHTFIKRNWLICETRWFYFWGKVAGQTCVSTSGIFDLHFPGLPLYAGFPCWHNRIVRSTHGTWSLARNGINEEKFGIYQRPQNIQAVETWLTVSYFINRAYQNFNTIDLPAGKEIIAARLGLYVTAKTGITGKLFLTKGLWDEPVTEADFALQTNEITILGDINFTDLITNAYNWIELNAAGIAWINQRPTEVNQHESYDWQKSAYHLIYGNNEWSQSFTPQTAHSLKSIKLRLKRIGNPGDVTFDIHNTTPAGCPLGLTLGQRIKAGILISTDIWGDWFEVIFPTPIPLSQGTTYAIKVWAPDGNASNRVEWIGSTANAYPNGSACGSDDGHATWTHYPNSDLYFIEYEENKVGGTKFCLRTDYDLSNVAPVIGADHRISYHSAQRGSPYEPLLLLYLEP